uniref:Uncharacterized protein n=1 Tax=Bos indicus x Bos taurus TaxID=30522 RepID=A0A4W2GD14_BOBOX
MSCCWVAIAFSVSPDSPVGVSSSPSENILQCNAVIFGPEGTLFEDGTFKLKKGWVACKIHKSPSKAA